MLQTGGALTRGHASPESLDGMLALAKPGAPILFSMSNAGYREYGFGTRIEVLRESGAWTLVDQSAHFYTSPCSGEHADLCHWVSVYRKTG